MDECFVCGSDKDVQDTGIIKLCILCASEEAKEIEKGNETHH